MLTFNEFSCLLILVLVSMSFLLTYTGGSQEFALKRDTTGGLGTEVPQRGPGAEPRWGSGGAEDIYANNNCWVVALHMA